MQVRMTLALLKAVERDTGDRSAGSLDDLIEAQS
jgi:hypothetical protein